MNEVKAIKLRRKLSESEKTVMVLREMYADKIDKNIELEVKVQRMRLQIGRGIT